MKICVIKSCKEDFIFDPIIGQIRKLFLCRFQDQASSLLLVSALSPWFDNAI
jgi:hypothetical protein